MPRFITAPGVVLFDDVSEADNDFHHFHDDTSDTSSEFDDTSS